MSFIYSQKVFHTNPSINNQNDFEEEVKGKSQGYRQLSAGGVC